MDFESLIGYEGYLVKLTLLNGYWYRAKILSVKKEAITFIEAKGERVSVSPSQIVMVQEIQQ